MKKTNKLYLIAEMGVNFYDTAKQLNITPLEAAKLYIDKAAEAGIDCAKFQSYKANTIVSKNSPAYWDTTKEATKTQYELFQKFDSFGESEYKELCDYTHSKGMDFTSTPFDYASADYLYDMVDFYKISSSDLSNTPFIKHIAAKGKPMVVSVGAAYLSEVDEAIRAMKEVGNNDICILHCVLSYPTDPKNANLRIIKTLKEVFPDVKVGFSDHVAPDPTMMTLATAYLLGSEVIEKHFTLDKTLPGPDHKASLEPDELKAMVNAIRNIEKAIGGSGLKEVSKSEEKNKAIARRSIVASKNIKKGELLTEENLIVKRPGTGLSPMRWNEVIDTKAIRDFEEDDLITM